MTEIKMYLDWIFNAQFAGIAAALKSGDYQRKGMNVHIIPWDGSSNVTELVSAETPGTVVVGSSEDNLLISAIAGGKSLIAVGTMLQRSPIGLMYSTERPLSEVNDLKGKRIGIHIDGTTMIEVILKKAGIAKEEVEIIETGHNSELLEKGEIDAYQSYFMVEPPELRRRGFETGFLPAWEMGYEVFSQMLFSTRFHVENNTGLLRAFLQTTMDGWREVIADPVKAAEIVQSYQPHIPLDVHLETIEGLIPWILGDLGADDIGYIPPEKLQKCIDMYREYGVIDKRLSHDEVAGNLLTIRSSR